MVIAGANVVEQRLLAETLEAIVVERPEPSADEPQNLCLDKGYDDPRSEEAATAAGYAPHIRRIGEEEKAVDTSKGHKPRRWVVERTFAWLSKCRGLLVRYEKSDINYLEPGKGVRNRFSVFWGALSAAPSIPGPVAPPSPPAIPGGHRGSPGAGSSASPPPPQGSAPR
ncbi:hypothetical protein OJF2_63290 [Aquisphaera giovannonii]|uniref:Transposase DDE domain-containing protein n=1 Tax=Aquisphaera giovannonii TaxID=406548 RepID=A0A5B9WAQ5_9BACT|nr:hypothetical protein OJF2_63290 [Aquisphaera giovannonii]